MKVIITRKLEYIEQDRSIQILTKDKEYRIKYEDKSKGSDDKYK